MPCSAFQSLQGAFKVPQKALQGPPRVFQDFQGPFKTCNGLSVLSRAFLGFQIAFNVKGHPVIFMVLQVLPRSFQCILRVFYGLPGGPRIFNYLQMHSRASKGLQGPSKNLTDPSIAFQGFPRAFQGILSESSRVFEGLQEHSLAFKDLPAIN